MTYIPGTGNVKPVKVTVVEQEKPPTLEMYGVINVEELKHPKTVEYKEDQDIWYNQLKYWMIFGGCLSSLFAILSVINWRFLLIIPLGPYAAYLTWHIRRWVKIHAKNFDAFSK